MGITLVSFVLILSLIVFVHELGHFLVARRHGIVVEEFGFGYPPRLIKLGKRNGTIYSLNLIPFGGFVRLRGEDDPSQPGNFAAASKWARATTLLAGAGMNFALAILLLTVLTMLSGVPDRSQPGAVIGRVVPGSPAEQGGLKEGDRIVAANETPVATTVDLVTHTRAHLGQPVTYRVVRRDPATGRETTLTFVITPRPNPPDNEGPLGIEIFTVMRRAWLWEALWSGVRTTGEVIWLTFHIPATLIREGRPITDAGLVGPVGIAAATGDVVRTAAQANSIQPVLWFVGLLSTAVGITNLLPIPALDGGRLLFVIAEALRRRRIEPAREGLIHLVGFALLLLIMGVVTAREITALVTGQGLDLGAR